MSAVRHALVRLAIALGVVILLILAAIGAVVAVMRVDRDREERALHPFYDPPVPLPAGRPGELIRMEALDAPDGVRAWRVLYHSTTFRGEDTAVSGMVAVPDGPAPAGGFPVIAVAHGTVGSARICAPSLNPFHARSPSLPGVGHAAESFYVQMVQPFIGAGYAVAATDYRGLGTPGPAPYLVGDDAARNVLDAARMIRRLPELQLSNDTVVWGHSQGGQSALFTGQIAQSYAPELRILGVVAGAPAAELAPLAEEVAQITGRSPLTGLLVMIVRSWSVAYPPDAKADTVLTSQGLRGMAVVDQECVGDVLLTFAFRPAPRFITPGGIARAPWPGLIEQNSAGAVRTPAPIFVFQGGSDPLIKPAFTEELVKQLCTVGDTVALKVYPGLSHLSVIGPSMPDALAWIADRLAGKAAPSTC